MKIVAGVDIGNSTTEVCIAAVSEAKNIEFLASDSTWTTGRKGSISNVAGIVLVITNAMKKTNYSLNDLSLILMNEAAPVIGDTAMETITETVITESTMIGHNPSTPAGVGEGVGQTLFISHLSSANNHTPYILVVPKDFDFEYVANVINRYQNSISIKGVILEKDEAVLVKNRIQLPIPIVDEVEKIHEIPEGKTCAIEVAYPGQNLSMLSNPYGIATLLQLTPKETQQIALIAKSFVGKQSGVVVKTLNGSIKEQPIPAGRLYFWGKTQLEADIDAGAKEIMSILKKAQPVEDITGQSQSNVGKMLSFVRKSMVEEYPVKEAEIKITDLLAVDTLIPMQIKGALAKESGLEKAVAIAAMVKTNKIPMEVLAKELERRLKVKTEIAGVEVIMAAFGALSTPGVSLPIGVLDLGGGSTDGAFINEDNSMQSIHHAGAGELVSMLIQQQLGLSSRSLAEEIKKYPLAKVESLFHIRLETGQVRFFQHPLSPVLFGKIVLLKEGELVPVEECNSMEKIVNIRKESKKQVFVTNAIRAMKEVTRQDQLNSIKTIVLVGGSALDFEIPELLMEEFSKYGIICGRGNIRANQGPRNAVATGLVFSYLGGKL